jgi:hypothetical protein
MGQGSVKLKGKKDCNERKEYIACAMRDRQLKSDTDASGKKEACDILKVRWLELVTSALEKQNAICTLNERTGLIREA